MLKPLSDRVIVKMLENEDKTESGILLSAPAKEKTQIAEVIAVGPGAEIDGKLTKMLVKEKDKVIINKYSGTEVKYKGEEYIIVSQNDILAVVE